MANNGEDELAAKLSTIANMCDWIVIKKSITPNFIPPL